MGILRLLLNGDLLPLSENPAQSSHKFKALCTKHTLPTDTANVLDPAMHMLLECTITKKSSSLCCTHAWFTRCERKNGHS